MHFFFKQAIRIIFYAFFSFHPPSSWDLDKGCETAFCFTQARCTQGCISLFDGEREGNTTPRKNIISDIDMSRNQIRAPRGPRWLGRFSFSDGIAVRFYFRSISMTQPSDGHSRRGGGVLFPSLFVEKRHSRWSRRIPQALPEGGGKIVLAQIGDRSTNLLLSNFNHLGLLSKTFYIFALRTYKFLIINNVFYMYRGE